MDTRSALTKRLLSALLVLAMLLPGFTPSARASAGAEPEASYESDVFSLHVGDTHQWKPFADYPGLRVAYRSSDPDVLSITSDGDSITVTNNLIPRVTRSQSSGLGLNYIREQYKERSGKTIVIEKTDDSYTVKLPML